jgi:hypothetical protein
MNNNLHLLQNIRRNNSTHASNLIDSLNTKNTNIHLGIFVEPYLTYVLNGKKIWESRFSVNKCAPYKNVVKGDILFIKKSGGLILGVCEIDEVLYFQLDKKSFRNLKENYSKLLCIEDPLFWEIKKNASYATLMKLNSVIKINPIEYAKKDRRGWVLIKNSSKQIEIKF